MLSAVLYYSQTRQSETVKILFSITAFPLQVLNQNSWPGIIISDQRSVLTYLKNLRFFQIRQLLKQRLSDVSCMLTSS